MQYHANKWLHTPLVCILHTTFFYSNCRLNDLSILIQTSEWWVIHDDVIKWKHFPRYCPCVRGIHWSPVNSPHKCQWRGALMFFYLHLNRQLSKQWGRWFRHVSMQLRCSIDTYMQITHMLSHPFLQICGICPQIQKRKKKKNSTHNVSSY